MQFSPQGGNGTTRASSDAGLYDHGRYPFVLDPLFPVEGALGGDGFVSYSNAALRPRPQLGPGGVLLGMTRPVFDVKVAAQKRNAYSRLSQNELAMELYRLGLFEDGRELQALACLELMEFDGKDALVSRVAATAGLREKLRELERYKALALALVRRYRPDMAAGLGVEPLPVPGGAADPAAGAPGPGGTPGADEEALAAAGATAGAATLAGPDAAAARSAAAGVR